MTAPSRPPSSARRLFSMSILISEVFVVLFAVLVVVGLRLVPTGAAWIAAGVLVAAIVAAAGLLRTRAGHPLGWFVQAALLAVSLAVPTMLALVVVFVALWVVAQRVGARIDRERAEQAATLGA